MLFTILAVMAVRPLAGLAAPVEPPAEPEPPQLAIEPDHYDFGLQPLNWGAREAWFQLRNDGTESLQVGSPQIVGPGHEAFWADNSPCYGSFLNPGESCPCGSTSALTARSNTPPSSVSVGLYSFWPI
jgi:hypothetical protein